MRIFFIALTFLISSDLQAIETPSPDSLLARRHYFQLREVLQSPGYQQLPVARKLYFQAFVQNFFHDLPASNQAIDQLLQHHKKSLTNKEIAALLMKKIDNHVKLYQYKEAHATGQLLLNNYKQALTGEEQEEVSNADIIWAGLQDIAPQSATIAKDTRIHYKRDLAGLINIPVQFHDSTFSFVFDTGANLSVISESYAKKTGVQILHKHFKVRAITGIEIDANLSVAKELRIGELVLRNVVFMVFPDSALSFAGGAYKIKGIIGFPVIEQLQELHIDKTGTITVPATITPKDIRNFGIDELVPVINVVINNNDPLAFTFDTGAQSTVLNEPFYTKYKATIESTGKAIDMQHGGAGGYVQSKGYSLPLTSFTVAGQTVTVPNITVKTSVAESKDRFYYGNLGQDVMYQFREMILNFKYMYVDFVK